jgi:hypothetical protein
LHWHFQVSTFSVAGVATLTEVQYGPMCRTTTTLLQLRF